MKNEGNQRKRHEQGEPKETQRLHVMWHLQWDPEIEK